MMNQKPDWAMTAREKLAMSLYRDNMDNEGAVADFQMKRAYDKAMTAANYFFDQLEKGND